MSVTVYSPVSNLKSASPLFRDRGIAGNPVELNESLTPIFSSVNSYNNLENHAIITTSVLAAMSKKSPFKSTIDDHIFAPQNITDLPLGIPQVHEVLKKEISPADAAKYKLRKVIIAKDRKNPIFPYVCPNPNFDTLKFLAPLEKVEKSIPMAGSGNVNMLRSFRHARRLIFAICSSIPLSRPAVWRSSYPTHSTLTYYNEMHEDVAVPESEAVDDKGDTKDGFDHVTVYHGSSNPPEFTIITSPANVGTSPFPHAILFPFFVGQTAAGGQMVKALLARFNLYSSKSAETAAALLGSLIEDISRPLNSRNGQELNHYAYGGIISYNKNVRPIPMIFGGHYVGFLAVSNHAFSVLTQHGKVVNSVSPSTLVEEAAKLSTHERAVEAIAKMLSGLEVDPGLIIDQEVGVDELQSTRDIAIAMWERANSISEASVSEKTEFRKHIADITFHGESPVVLTLECFTRWAKCVYDETFYLKEFPDEGVYTFLKGVGLQGDADYLNSAIFGGLGWSPLTPGGDRITITDPSLEKDPARVTMKVPVSLENGKVEYKDEYPLRYIVFHRVPIDQAAKDWAFIKKHGYITIPKKAPPKKDLAHKVFISDNVSEWWSVFRKNFYKAGAEEGAAELDLAEKGKKVDVAKYRPDGEDDDF